MTSFCLIHSSQMASLQPTKKGHQLVSFPLVEVRGFYSFYGSEVGVYVRIVDSDSSSAKHRLSRIC